MAELLYHQTAPAPLRYLMPPGPPPRAPPRQQELAAQAYGYSACRQRRAMSLGTPPATPT